MAEQRNSRYAPAAPKQGDSDLYAQIAAGDQEEEKASRAKSSFVMNLMVEYMRLMLLIDSKRRQYQKLFRILGGIWAILMILLYLTGFAMLLILIVSYMRFPTEIKNYLERNGVVFEEMQIPGYIISQVEIKGLHDKGNTYRIDTLSISSTFADFLNRRARNVSAKGVRFTLDPMGQNAENPLQILSRLHQGNGKSDLKIDMLKISDAVITVKGKDYSIPVSLSLAGIYGNETNIGGYLSINEPSLKLGGPLTIRNEKGKVQWDLNVNDGQVSFPGRPLEKMKGTIGIRTDHLKIHSLTADLSFLANQDRRDIKLSLDKKKDLFSGSLSLKWLDVSNASKPVERTKLDFILSDLKLSPNGGIQTQSPVRMSLTTKYSSELQIIALSGSLTGNLSCQLFDSCSYQLDKAALLSAKKVAVRNRGTEITNRSRFQFSLEPVKNLVDVSFKTGRMNFDFKTKNFIFNGEETESKNSHLFKAALADVSGHLNLWDKDILASLSLKEFSYQNPSMSLDNGRLKVDNIFDDNGHIYLNSSKVVLRNNSQIKVPFSLTYSKDKGVAGITTLLENKRIQLLFGGTFDWVNGYINGQVVIPTIDLSSLRQPLNRISDLVPATFKKTTGRVSAYGHLSGNLYSELKGPLYVSLSDFGFETDQLKIQNLNAALSAQSVRPFVTDPDQKIYIGSIESFLPISDVDITLKAEDNYAQLRELSANVSGIRLYAGETVVPYKNIGTLIYLRNRDEDLTDITKTVQIKDWKNNGSVRGSILFPVEIKDMSLNVRNAILQVFDAEMEYTGPAKNKPAFMGKNTKFSVTSGTVTIDTLAQDGTKDNKISVLLDTVLLPSRLKKTLRHVFSGKLSDVMTFRSSPAAHVSPDLMSQIRHIQNQADKFRVK